MGKINFLGFLTDRLLSSFLCWDQTWCCCIFPISMYIIIHGGGVALTFLLDMFSSKKCVIFFLNPTLQESYSIWILHARMATMYLHKKGRRSVERRTCSIFTLRVICGKWKDDSEIDFHKVPLLPFYFDSKKILFKNPVDIQTSGRMILLMLLFVKQCNFYFEGLSFTADPFW